MLRYLLLLVLLSAGACRLTQTPGAATDQQQVTVGPANQIIFLDLEIVADTLTRKTKVNLLNKIITDGRLKRSVHPDRVPKPGDIKYSLLAGKKQVLHSNTIPDPLANTLEYASESGVIEQKTFHLAKATFTIRAPFYPGTTHLLIEQLQKDDQFKEIARLPL